MMIRRTLHFALSALLLFGLAACPEEVVAPTVTASYSNTGEIHPGMIVSLDGSESVDTNTPALPLSFRWDFASIPYGSHAEFNDAHLLKPSFVPDVSGMYVVRLTASNGILTTAAEPLNIEVTDCATIDLSVDTLTADPVAPAVGVSTQLVAVIGGTDSCEAGNYLTYHWSFVQAPTGSQAALNDTGLRNPSFTPDVQGLYVVQLVVSDNIGRTSAPNELEITASPCGAGVPVVTGVAVSPAAPLTGQDVKLTPDAGDPDNDAACGLAQDLTYWWDLVDKPAGSSATLSNATAQQPWFNADVPGDYRAVLVVTDSTGLSNAPFSVSVTVDACGNNAPEVQATVAAPASLALGDTAQLSATVVDADNDTCAVSPAQQLSYWWTVVSAPQGSLAALNDAALQGPSITPDVAGSYVVELVVTDDTGRASNTGSVTVTATPCSVTINAPAAGFNTLQWAEVTTTLSDPSCDATVAGYWWVVSDQPLTGDVQIDNAASANPGMWASEPGDITVTVTVTDTGGGTYSSTTTLTVATCGSAAPTAEIAQAQPYTVASGGAINAPSPVPPGTAVVLNASGSSDADDAAPCSRNDPLTYWWTFAVTPPGSTVGLSGANTVEASFVPDQPGLYVVNLMVDDGHHDSAVAATFTAQADKSLSIGSPQPGCDVNPCVEFVAGGAGNGFDQPSGVIEVQGVVYVLNEGNDTILQIDTLPGSTQPLITELTSGAFLNAPRRITYDFVTDAFYVLNSGDDFVIRVDRVTGQQALWLGLNGQTITALAEDLDIYHTGAAFDVPELAVVGRFGVPSARIDRYAISATPPPAPLGSITFGNNLTEPYCVEAHFDANGNNFWAQSQELQANGGGRLRHLGAAQDIYLDDSYSALFLEDMSFEVTDDYLYVAVGGGVDFVARVPNCIADNCGIETVATGFDVLGGIFAAGPQEVLATDRGENAVYRISF